MDEAFMALEQPAWGGVRCWLTEFRQGDRAFGGRVTARDWTGARLICALRGYGETVVGELVTEVRHG
jgi:hypothetical protein